MYLNALEVRKKLTEQNSETYLPDLTETQFNFGILFSDLGRFEDAEDMWVNSLKTYKMLAEKSPKIYLHKVAETLNNLGILYQNLNKFETALMKFNEVLEINLDNQEAWAQKGYCLHKLKRYHEAEESNDKALKIDVKYSIAWYNKACIESIKNNKEKSIDFLKISIDLDKKFIDMAKADQDFDNIRSSKEFKELT